MIEYFKLQFILTKRKLYDATLMNSYLVAVICLLLFVGVSIALFRIINEYAQYLYIIPYILTIIAIRVEDIRK